MSDRITILWPSRAAPEIMEAKYSFSFCRRISREFCVENLSHCLWVDYAIEQTLYPLLSQTEGDLLIITDPEIVLSHFAVRRMQMALQKGSICGPVFNQTAFINQSADLSVPYLNVATYMEVAETLAEDENKGCIVVKTLDPGCILCRQDFLKDAAFEKLLTGTPLSFVESSNGACIVDTGALIHRFGRYYEETRDELVKLVPKIVKRVLDIGCAKGGYGRNLKAARQDVSLIGVEINPLMAEAAEAYYDQVIVSSAEDADLPEGIDLINCGDVLEHLKDPWAMLHRFHDILKPGGFLICSIPNMGHWTIVKDLLEDKFQYIPFGLASVGHLRWFTESSVVRALAENGFIIDVLQRIIHPCTPAGETFIRTVCAEKLGDEASLRTYEFIIRAIKK